ncbi:hypothetical protein IWW39_000486 [Coemansia spiralis]|uniref:Uncharacterized protein n=1 Tax=Coemansia spiralis TaxID=417178 RepID=A0A9W8GMH9_9FUNG|nr:hypothetical protein IWW39_000486 [Coemansia spiralis]
MRHENISFPTANTLVLLLSKAANDQTGMAPPISKEDVANFVRPLLQLTPAATSVSLRLFALSDTEPNYEQLYDALVSELHRGKITCLDVRNKLDDPATGSVSDFPLSLSLRGVSGLTSISHGPDIPCAPFSRLAYLNASTLKTLDIKLAEESDWTDLIYGGSEVSAVYSSLESLSLDIVNVPYPTNWAAIEGAKPFPKLSTLDLSGRYPFDDDLFFRGNGGTLQNLRILFRAIARNILGRFSVLKRSGVTRMNQIHIGEVSIVDRVFVDGSAKLPIKQQIQRMVEVTATLKQHHDTWFLDILWSL